MKELMIGNAAFARGLYEAGVKVASSYPGTPSTEITECLATYDDVYCEWAPNEKVAMEVAFGASLRGVRSFCAMKHVGLNVAADPLFTLSYTGVNGGLVIAVADDPGMHSSQNEQDSRHYAIAAKVPMLEPADSAETKEYVKLAYEISEKFDTPVIVRMCTRIAHSQSIVQCEDRIEKELGAYEKNGAKYIMMPGNAIKRHPFVEERTIKLAQFAETDEINRVESGNGDLSFGIITSGTCYQYVKEVFGDSVPVLKLGMVNPLPENLIKEFASSVERVYVIEELDPIIETHCKNIGVDVIGKEMFGPLGEFSQESIAKAFGIFENDAVKLDETIPVRPPMMCAGCPHRGLFYTLSKNKITALGDIGCYTLGAVAPLMAIDSTLCMGASVSGLHGFNKADEEACKNSVCVIGDSTFMHSGITGLVNIAYNASNSTVIILDNSITGMTGHQQNPTTGYNIKGDVAAKVDLETLCKACGIGRVRVVDPYNLAECEAVIKEELSIDEPSVIISRRPCVLLKSVKAKSPVVVNKDKCKSCKKCMKLGCPAISFKNNKAHIDSTLCVGCDVCKQMCAFDAIESEERNND
ncbi:MAG: indolepyruvate ferredoxin oxidoreductase subunit alpha [Clostridia bacterium]|nr:indolepyruvate ferredoxin oxidoreductase subunit alpha [Clostridia bacterium]